MTYEQRYDLLEAWARARNHMGVDHSHYCEDIFYRHMRYTITGLVIIAPDERWIACEHCDYKYDPDHRYDLIVCQCDQVVKMIRETGTKEYNENPELDDAFYARLDKSIIRAAKGDVLIYIENYKTVKKLGSLLSDLP